MIEAVSAAPVALEYADPQARRVPRAWLWITATIIAVVSALYVMLRSFDLAARVEMMRVPTDCGTGRHEPALSLFFFVPTILFLPIAGWLIARWSGQFKLLCLCACWSSIAAWLTCVMFVLLR